MHLSRALTCTCEAGVLILGLVIAILKRVTYRDYLRPSDQRTYRYTSNYGRTVFMMDQSNGLHPPGNNLTSLPLQSGSLHDQDPRHLAMTISWMVSGLVWETDLPNIIG